MSEITVQELFERQVAITHVKALLFNMTLSTVPKERQVDELAKFQREECQAWLQAIDAAGFSIVRKEPVPKAFTDALPPVV